MPPVFTAALVYLAVVNLAACAAALVDKRRARRDEWRIPESTLLLLAALGGSVSMLITMKLIRHKTRKAKFMVGIPVILALQLLLDVPAAQERGPVLPAGTLPGHVRVQGAEESLCEPLPLFPGQFCQTLTSFPVSTNPAQPRSGCPAPCNAAGFSLLIRICRPFRFPVKFRLKF